MSDLDASTTKLLEEAKKLAADAAAKAAVAEVEARAAKAKAQDAAEAADDASEAAKAAGNAAADAVEKIEAALEDGPPDPVPVEGLILARSDVKVPEELPVGKLKGTKTIVGVWRLPVADGKWRKPIGCDSSSGRQGGFCAGQSNDGRAEFWIDDGNGIQPIMLASRAGKASFFAMRITDVAFAAAVDDVNQVATRIATPVPFDGMAAIGKGVYGHQYIDPMTPAELIRLEVWADLKPWDWIAAKKEEWKDLIDEGGTAPPEPIPPTPGEFHVRPDMSQSDAMKAINDRGPGAVVAYAPGTYHLGTINPKDGQRHLGVIGQTILEGDKQNKRAFAGAAKSPTLEALTVQHYGAGGPTRLDPGASGSRGPWLFTLAAIRPATLDPQRQGGSPPAKGWTLKSMVIRENYCEGVGYCDFMTIVGSKIHDNGSCGSAGFATNVSILNNEFSNNSRWHWDARDHAGEIKTQAGYGATHGAMRSYKIIGNVIHDGWGDGIWLDFNMWDYEIARNSVWNKTHNALHLEACAEVFVHHNQFGLGGGSLGGTLQGTINLQNAKHVRMEKNLVVVTHSSALWILQHNKTNRPNISDRHIGLFAGCHNAVLENVFLMINSGSSFKVDHQPNNDFSGDPNCNSLIVPAASDAIDPRGHMFCFFPRSAAAMATVVDGNTYRMPGTGQNPARINWPNETNARVISPGDPASYVPKNWNQVPTWDVPPGRAA